MELNSYLLGTVIGLCLTAIYIAVDWRKRNHPALRPTPVSSPSTVVGRPRVFYSYTGDVWANDCMTMTILSIHSHPRGVYYGLKIEFAEPFQMLGTRERKFEMSWEMCTYAVEHWNLKRRETT